MSNMRKPTLTLETPPGKLKHISNSRRGGGSLLVLVLQIVVVGLLTLLLLRGNQRTQQADRNAPMAEELKDLALQLENKSLSGEAARAWEKYLDAAPDETEKAEIFFRIGKMYMQSEQFDRAATALIRCELADDAGNLETKIGQNLVTCLRRLGLYGEVGRELSRRVETGGEEVEQGKILATLAGEQLTEADLDRLVERRVDQMLSLQGHRDDSMRQAVLKQFSSPEMRQQLFQDLLRTELFTRRARELKLDQDDEFLQARQALENNLLASRFQSRKFSSVQPTDVDIETYYKAEQGQYREPASLETIVIELTDDDDATQLLENLKTTDDFKQLANTRRSKISDAADEYLEDDVPVQTLVQGQRDPTLGTTDSLFSLAAGQWTNEPHTNGEQRFLVLVQKKSPAQTPPLSEIRPRVTADYMARKQQELSQKLFADLMDRYNVKVITLPNEPAGDHRTAKTARGTAKADHAADNEQDAETESGQ